MIIINHELRNMTSEVAKVIPKRFTSRFTVSKTGKRSNSNIKNEAIDIGRQRKVKSMQVVFFTELPSLPTPSIDLQEILIRFNQATRNCAGDSSWGSQLFDMKVPTRKSRIRCKKTRCLNGFMAFRSFYSRSIYNVEHQRELSTLLGKLWKNEPNKAIWNRYAIEYNSQAINQDFVDWLFKALGLEVETFPIPYTSTVRNESWTFSSLNNENAVEDIYYIVTV